MSDVVLAEHAGAAQRVRLPEFGQNTPEPPSVARLEEIEQAAYQEGFEQGRAEGWKTGEEQVRDLRRQLGLLIRQVIEPLAETEVETEKALISLACEVASALVCRQLDEAPEMLGDMVSRALRMMDRSRGRVEISLHPRDMEILAPVLATDPDFGEVSFTSDSALKRGDFFLHTENAAIDGTLATRTQRLREQLLGDR